MPAHNRGESRNTFVRIGHLHQGRLTDNGQRGTR